MNIGYVRVSSADQNWARQEEALKAYHIDKWYEEKISGKDMRRPKLREMLSFLKEGDVVYVSELSRLARSTRDLCEIAMEIDEKGCKLISIKENMDFGSSTGKLIFHIIGAMAEFERENIRERQREGIEAAKKRGVVWGNQKIMDMSVYDSLYERYYRGEIGLTNALKEFGYSQAKFYVGYKKWKDLYASSLNLEQ